MRPVVIEARINEYTGREPNPHVPWSNSEIVDTAVECAEVGASIIHFHSRTDTGAPDNSYEKIYEVVSGIRKHSDVLIQPTLGINSTDQNPLKRIENIVRLSEVGLKVDFAPLDIASGNIDFINLESGQFVTNNQVYVNPTGDLQTMAAALLEVDVKPYAVCWHIPSLRQAVAFAKQELLGKLPVLQLTFSGGGGLFGHPATEQGLNAFTSVLPKKPHFAWNTYCFGESLIPLLEPILQAGGHIATGLGDYHYQELGLPNNAQLIRHFAKRIEDCGYEVATVAEAKSLYGIDLPPPTSPGCQLGFS